MTKLQVVTVSGIVLTVSGVRKWTWLLLVVRLCNVVSWRLVLGRIMLRTLSCMDMLGTVVSVLTSMRMFPAGLTCLKHVTCSGLSCDLGSWLVGGVTVRISFRWSMTTPLGDSLPVSSIVWI